MRNQLLTGGVILVCAIMMVARGVTPAETFSAHVSATGAIHLPRDFRLTMVHLGSWFVPQGEASGFHDVYTEASTAEMYR
ncbi:MAG: cytochrome C, partial [Candidatus Tectomicrobia bacterium]|nr:cytochrome C [Candidatus Tectomicrobia bacterium]